MKHFAIAFLLASALPAFAADKAPTCGKTIEECQKANDDLTARLGYMTLSRNAFQSLAAKNPTAIINALADEYVQQQAAAIAAKPVQK